MSATPSALGGHALYRRAAVRAALTRLAPRALSWGFVLILCYLVVVPLVRLQAESLSGGASSYRKVFGTPEIGSVLLRTAGLAVGSLTIAIVVGTLLAVWAKQLPRPFGWMKVLPIMPIIIPAVASISGWSILLSPGPGYLNALLRHLPWWSGSTTGPLDVYSTTWIVLIVGFNLSAFMFLFVTSGLENISSELIEASMASGSSQSRAFRTVVLPLLRPALVYGSGIVLLLGLGQFTAPLLLGRTAGIDVLTTDVYFYMQQVPVDYGAAAAAASPLLAFGVAVVAFQKLYLGDQRRFVTHGGKSFSGSWKSSKISVVGIGLFTVLATVAPIVALGIVSLTPFWSASVDPSTFSLDSFRQALDAPNITSAITNSVLLSALAVVIVMPLGWIAATTLLSPRAGRLRRNVLDFVVAAPLAIPAVLFGAGFLLTYTEPPFILYGTPWVLLVVYVTLMIPFATRIMMSGITALGSSYEEASHTCGASTLQTKLKILLPLLRPTLGGGGALVFILLTHEFTASLLVRSPTQQVMGTVLYDYWDQGQFPTVAAIALIMTAITAAGVVVAMLLGGGSAAFKRL